MQAEIKIYFSFVVIMLVSRRKSLQTRMNKEAFFLNLIGALRILLYYVPVNKKTAVFEVENRPLDDSLFIKV